ncbi:SCO family protein [Bacillus shivajii]|uniref:SCO family protein n=1 Tax=Bacillus shivajii TaxID=1983719 RepID=UPI001CF9382E|nr:SCO family protein [Bacillus shivajii]UCZ51997.1 SCO family protein [Bacillus shivajii]
MNFLKLSFVLLAMVVVSGCSFLYQAPQPPESDAIIDVTQSDEEFHIADFEAVNQSGVEISKKDMLGEWWLAKTIFTRCPTVCMTMTPNMVDLQGEILERDLDIRIVSFTVDPEFDTPERLEDYGESYGASFDNWDFVTGYSQEHIKEFSLESFRVPVVPGDNDIGHPTRFYLINPEGEIVRFYSGESRFDLDAISKDLEFLLSNE